MTAKIVDIRSARESGVAVQMVPLSKALPNRYRRGLEITGAAVKGLTE